MMPLPPSRHPFLPPFKFLSCILLPNAVNAAFPGELTLHYDITGPGCLVIPIRTLVASGRPGETTAATSTQCHHRRLLSRTISPPISQPDPIYQARDCRLDLRQRRKLDPGAAPWGQTPFLPHHPELRLGGEHAGPCGYFHPPVDSAIRSPSCRLVRGRARPSSRQAYGPGPLAPSSLSAP